MKLAIMQPYIFPYIGYYQLMNAVDEFIFYDNIQFIKNGWINRNRILNNSTDSYITFPLRKDSYHLNVRDRYLADIWPVQRKKMLTNLKVSYRQAPFYDLVFPIIEKTILFPENNLFEFILNSQIAIKEYLDIHTPLITSSSIEIDHTLKGQEKVITICKHRNADTYINSIGGIDLYDKSEFKKYGIELKFHKTRDIIYKQFNNDFVPSLSIIDVMMFNSTDEIKNMINQYDLV
jgi:WbqC-like protein family